MNVKSNKELGKYLFGVGLVLGILDYLKIAPFIPSELIGTILGVGIVRIFSKKKKTSLSEVITSILVVFLMLLLFNYLIRTLLG